MFCHIDIRPLIEDAGVGRDNGARGSNVFSKRLDLVPSSSR